MKWEGNRESDNVEDRRGGSGRSGFGGRSIGIGSIAIALVSAYLFGVNPMTVLSLLSGGPGALESGQQAPAQRPPASDQAAKFVAVVLADTEDAWTELFRDKKSTYIRPKLALFSGSTPTACGTGQSATGPFYCPADQMIYIDLSFFRLMKERFNVSSEFAEAYVIAHEVAHHVQNQLGISGKVEKARQSASETQANALSVRLELQADCFAGVWAFHADRARNILEQGDIEGALNAAAAIGDDALQSQAQGHVIPDSFTHGTSAQRVSWFTRGIKSGQIEACDTFQAKVL